MLGTTRTRFLTNLSVHNNIFHRTFIISRYYYTPLKAGLARVCILSQISGMKSAVYLLTESIISRAYRRFYIIHDFHAASIGVLPSANFPGVSLKCRAVIRTYVCVRNEFLLELSMECPLMNTDSEYRTGPDKLYIYILMLYNMNCSQTMRV